VVTSSIGLGATVFFFLMSQSQKDVVFLTGLGVTAFLIGLGLIINALLFTVPKQYVSNAPMNTRRRDLIEEAPDRVIALRRELTTAEPLSPPPSITEQTTHHLADTPAAPSRAKESG
jgi:hypothetical protein